VRSDFAGRLQGVRGGDRLYAGAPPVTPHDEFMREDCNACHAGPTARPEIVCDHSERVNCAQCHARGGTHAEPFVSPFGPGIRTPTGATGTGDL
jgi:cytochrome c-type protein NapB